MTTHASDDDAGNPRAVVEALLHAIVDGDDAAVARLGVLSGQDVASLRTRHTTSDGVSRLSPEFTVVDGDRVTTVVWLPVVVPEGTLDLYSFDSFVVQGGRVVDTVTSASSSLKYDHVRSQIAPRRGRPEGADEIDVPERRAHLVMAFNRDVFGAGSPDVVDRFVTEDYRQHAEWRGESGREALKRIVVEIQSQPEPPGFEPPRPLFESVQGAIVIAAAAMGPNTAFDAYLVRDGLLAEHWSGIDPRGRARA